MIYLIENILTNEKYVGYTSQSLDKRFAKHIQNSRAGGETYLYRAIRKYGEHNFKIICLQEDGSLEQDESKWIESLKPEYNMTNGGEGGDTSSSPNFIRAMKEYHANKPKREYATNGFSGKVHDESSKEKQALARKTHWQNLSSEELKIRSSKVSGSKNGMFGKAPKNSVPVIVDGVQYTSRTEATRKLNKSWHMIKKEHNIL
jgi:group I intron endonuclease